ncbi:hypothetical protein WJX79_004352 [Trebouxia sp. C0005]
MEASHRSSVLANEARNCVEGLDSLASIESVFIAGILRRCLSKPPLSDAALDRLLARSVLTPEEAEAQYKDLLTSLPPYDTGEAVIHEVYRDIVAAMVCRTSKRPCKLPAVVLAAVLRYLTPMMTADSPDAVCGVVQPLLEYCQRVATTEGCSAPHQCAQIAVQGLMTVVLVIVYTYPGLQGVCLDKGVGPLVSATISQQQGLAAFDAIHLLALSTSAETSLMAIDAVFGSVDASWSVIKSSSRAAVLTANRFLLSTDSGGWSPQTVCDVLELGVAVLMPPFDMHLPGLSRLVLNMIASCLQLQLEHQELRGDLDGNAPLLKDQSLLHDDQALVRQSVGPQRNTTAAAVASLVIVAVKFIREERQSPNAVRLLPHDQDFALSLSALVFRYIRRLYHHQLGGVVVVLAASWLQVFTGARPCQLQNANTQCAILTGLQSEVMEAVYGAAAQAGGQQPAEELTGICIAALCEGQVLTSHQNLKLHAFLKAWFVSEVWVTQRGERSERSVQAQRWASGQDAIDAIPRVPVLLPCSPDHSDAVVAPGGNTQNERPANSSDSPSEPTPGVATADAAVREPTHSAEPAQGGPVGRTAAGPRQAGKLVVDDDRGDKDGLPAGLRHGFLNAVSNSEPKTYVDWPERPFLPSDAATARLRAALLENAHARADALSQIGHEAISRAPGESMSSGGNMLSPDKEADAPGGRGADGGDVGKAKAHLAVPSFDGELRPRQQVVQPQDAVAIDSEGAAAGQAGLGIAEPDQDASPAMHAGKQKKKKGKKGKTDAANSTASPSAHSQSTSLNQNPFQPPLHHPQAASLQAKTDQSGRHSRFTNNTFGVLEDHLSSDEDHDNDSDDQFSSDLGFESEASDAATAAASQFQTGSASSTRGWGRSAGPPASHPSADADIDDGLWQQGAELSLDDLVNKAISRDCTCPISQEPFVMPVMAADGCVYESCEIQDWMARNNSSPVTNLPFLHQRLTAHSAPLERLSALQSAFTLAAFEKFQQEREEYRRECKLRRPSQYH